MSSTIDKFINSSLSIGFLTLTAFSTAYCYIWGQAWYHGLPWWHVDIGNGLIARTLAWVLGSSLILLLSYVLGYYLLKKIAKSNRFEHLGYLRVLILVSVFNAPVMLSFYLFIGKIPLYVSWVYLGLLLLCVILFHRKWNNTDLQLDFRKLLLGQGFVLFVMFIFLYFSILSLCIGYWRSDLRQTYDYIEIQGKKYYILATNGEKGYIMGEAIRNNREFLFFNRENQQHYRIHMVKMAN
ncbi:MAG: hypothetical protein Q4B82_04800 [Alysiella sp.]|uniref:hypothetical protein n=1 Tax=Alysiella sp. TaxID=1872483 RepID=UPI0026DAA4EC|nr:hypothetical protein [Alysiella sp.]MDO4433881.1 hypothetical protein [Alysiella sp.]